MGSAGWGTEFSRWVCFPAPRGQWGSAKGGQVQLASKRGLCGLLWSELSTANYDCTLPTARRPDQAQHQGPFLEFALCLCVC